MGQSQHSRSRHARGAPSRAGLGVLLAAVALAVVAGGAGFALGRGGADEPASPSGSRTAATASSTGPAAPGAASGPPTLMGQVSRVASGDEIMVRVGEVEEPVRVLGLDTPDLATEPGAAAARCGSREALAFADSRLTGQTVTLVPDPTGPERDERGTRLAYVVLRSQLNYTDAALNEGVGRADTSRPLWYADVFAREQADAVRAERGIWGEPCNTTP